MAAAKAAKKRNANTKKAQKNKMQKFDKVLANHRKGYIKHVTNRYNANPVRARSFPF